VDAKAELAFGQQGRPAFHQIQPTGRSRREMHMEAGAFDEPVLDQLRLVSSVVVQDHVDVQLLGHVLLDGVEETAKLDRAMALLILADDLAGLCIKSGKRRSESPQTEWPDHLRGSHFLRASTEFAISAHSPRLDYGACFPLPCPTALPSR
jgi:hypothetical protein